MDTKENAQEVVDLLNELFKLDPDAARDLASTRHNCSQSVADHPRFIVMDDPKDGFCIGMIGFINALFSESHRVAYCVEDDGTFSGFKVVDITPK